MILILNTMLDNIKGENTHAIVAQTLTALHRGRCSAERDGLLRRYGGSQGME